MQQDEVVYEATTIAEYVVQWRDSVQDDTEWHDEQYSTSLEEAKLFADYLKLSGPMQDVRVVRRVSEC